MSLKTTVQLQIGPELFPRVLKKLRLHEGHDIAGYAAVLQCSATYLEQVETGIERPSVKLYDVLVARYQFLKVTQLCLLSSISGIATVSQTIVVGPLELKQLAIFLVPQEMKIIKGGLLK